MARVFLSHSSKDQRFARQLAEDLRALGHQVWLDKWEIKVGESITSKIEHGLATNDYLVIVLSPDAVSSGWVDREWKAKYWEEVQSGRTQVLPALVRDCEIPLLLRDKLYADFRESYAVGLVKLTAAIAPVVGTQQSVPIVDMADSAERSISALLAKVQSPASSISNCLVEALSIAQAVNAQELEQFCRAELTGWDTESFSPEEAGASAPHREIEIFTSTVMINLAYIGFGGSGSAAISYMESNPKQFVPQKMFVTHSVSYLEAQPQTDVDQRILRIVRKAGDLDPNTSDPEVPVYHYARGSSFVEVLRRIRAELTKQLLNLLPSSGATPSF